MANNQHFTLTFDAQLNVNQMKGALTQIQSTLNGLHLPQNLSKGLQTTFNTLSKQIQDFEVAIGKDITSKTDFKKLDTQATKIVDTFEKLKLQIQNIANLSGTDLAKLLPPSVTSNITNATKALQKYEQAVTAAKADVQDAQDKINKLNQQIADINNKTPLSGEQWKQLKADIAAAEAEVSKYNQQILQAQNTAAEVENRTQNYKQSSIWRQAQKDIQTYTAELKKAEAVLKGLTQKKATSITYTGQAEALQKLNIQVANAQQSLQQLQVVLNNLQSAQSGGGLEQLLATIGQITGLDMTKFSSDAQGAANAINTYLNQALQILSTNLNGASSNIQNTSTAFNNLTQNMQNCSGAMSDFDDRTREINALKSRIQYFFGLNNAINLVKRAIRGAVETVKELDAAMTETAVVTNYTIADMWEQLPEYTKRANELGVTTKDAYESATLYFQQGLNADQAAALSTETLKMARIAGLEAAEATDRMTNALRGFNMELDAVNAQRVDDVYSQLAAMSASNVDEISTAMTKVASLAHSANMEFETTAAFLAQIIETTRESAETAGTALKTVVARFSEVKKLYSIDELKGTDEEGQGIDVNKISTALRTAGIDLNKYFLGEVGLDDIFMELASKWDSLTGVQQRYIATQAAGSRQQSRFIALMQDYARMQELVGAAYSSTGASAKQFEKTQDSLQSKLARLKNAWNEFLMGLANNNIIKIAVDVLTNLINGLNNLTSALGKNIGSLLKWIAVVSAFKGVKGLFSTNGPVDKILAGMMGNTLGRQNAGGAGGGGTINSSTTWNGTNWVAPQRRGLFFNFGQRRQGRINAFDEIQAQGGQLGAGAGLFGQLGSKLASRGLGKRFAGTKAAGGLAKLLGFGSASGGAAAGGAGAAAAAGLAAALTGVAIAATAAAAAYGIWYSVSPEGQLKQATKYAKVMAETATNAKKAAEEVKKAQESYKKYNAAVEEANTIDEKSNAIEDRNSYIASLIEQNKEFAQYVTAEQKDNQFVLTINEEALEKAVKDISTKAVNAEIASSFANAMQAGLQADVYGARRRRANVNLEDNTIGPEGAARALTNVERAKYLQEFQAENISRKEQLNYAQQAYSRIFAQAGLEDEAANLLSRAFAESFDENEYLSKVNSKRFSNWMNGAGSKEALRQQYLDLFGTPADSNLSRKELAKLVAQEQISQEYAGKTKGISDLVTGKAGNDILSLLSGYFGEGFNDKNLASLNWNNEAEIWGILGATGENADELVEGFKELAQILGIDINLIRDRIKQNAKEQKMRQAEAAFKTSGDLYASGVNAQGITQFLQLDLEDQQLFQNIYSSFDPSFISDKLANTILTGIAQGDEALTSWLKSIDLSNPIQAFKELSIQAQKGTGLIQTVAQELLNAGNASKQFSASNQLAYLTLSGNYESLSASLADFIKENGSISSANILELAEANSDLNALIESNIMSANGLAIALTGIETGTFTILDLTDSVLAAINAMDDLDGVVASIIKELSDFDPGYDENDITSFIGKVYKNASENIENGAYGNNVMGNYMRKIFGDFKWDGTGDYGDAYKEWLNNNLTWLEQNQDNMFSAWDDFVGASDRRILQAGEHQAELLEQNGEIIIHANGATTEELVNAMVEQGHMTETMARMMIADFKNYSADFAHEMGLNDMPNAVEAFAKQISDKGWYLDSELDTLATILGVNREQIKTELEKYGDFANINLGDQTATDIISALNQIYGNGGNVDLNNRPKIDVSDLNDVGWYTGSSDGTATVFSNTYTNEAGTIAANFTPILPNGKILSPSELQKYAEGVLEGAEDTLHLQIGTQFEGEDTDTIIAEAEQAAQNIHHIQSLLYQDGNEKIFDWDGIKQAMDDVDLGGYFENVINDVAQVGDTITTHFFGQVQNTTIEEGYTAGQTYAEAYQKAVNENLATQIGTVFEKIFTGLEINIDNENGLVKIKEVQDKLDVVNEGADASVGATIEPDVVNNLDTIIQKLNDIRQGATATVTFGNGSTSGGSSPAGYHDGGGIPHRASGGTVKSFANGSANISLSPGVALTGEEGPEIVWNKKKGYAYITGEDHPEFQDLKPGDRVFNAQETKKIFGGAATGGQVPSYARGYGGGGKGGSGGNGGGSGSGGKDKENEWKNDLDWLYNLMEDIVELERDQKALEEQYEDYLQDQSKTGQDLYKLLIKQLGNLYTQLQHQQFALEKREQEMREFMDVTNDKDQYLWYNWQDRTIEIDWDAIDQITDEDEYKHVKELINEAEEIQDKIDDADDSIMDITNQIQELEHIWRDTYVDFEKRVLDALVKSYQKVIDNYSELNDTLNDSNSQILQSLQKEIDLQRQIRDNTKTEEEIADDEARLAYLRRDTSGGNDLDALQLEKDLNDQRESYTDTLIDQAIQRLQNDNDAAAQQRERQIEIMQAQLDYQSENGEFNAFIRQLMEDAISPDGQLLTDSELYNLLKTQENWEAMSDVNKQVWEEELNNTFKEVVAFLLKENSVENGTFYTAVTAAIEGLTSIIGSYSQSITKLGKSSSGGGSSGGGNPSSPPKPAQSETVINRTGTYIGGSGNNIQISTGYGDGIIKRSTTRFSTGGLATSTGPAWLDGTPKEPEYVLNARQTDAFLKLADVLPSVISNNSSSGVNNTFGATTFNLSVNVDKIASDYDVDHMCDLIKEKLYDSGSYRNVNSLSFLR